MFPPVLAHGALGPYDEVIFAAVAFAFLVLMGFSWWRNRDEEGDAAQGTDGRADAPAEGPAPAAHPAASPDRIRLE
jgi:hypothetical protein